MKPRMVSALAPKYTVVMMIELDSRRGYCRTGRPEIARHPTARITRVMTTASTRFLMKISVNDFMCTSWRRASPRVPAASDPLPALLRRFFGFLCVRRLSLEHHRALAQLERPGRGHLVAGLQTLRHA